MKKPFAILTALALTAALLCPAAAAGSPVLHIQGGGGSAQLTLQNLGNREVNSVQLELTLEGSYPQASFSQGSGSGAYSHCKVDASGTQTTITLYIDSVKTLNQRGTASLGTLTLGGGYTAPSSAQLTILDHGLNGGGPANSIPVQVASDSSPGWSDSSASDYPIRVTSGGHGTVTARPSRAERGETVTVTARPDSGFQLYGLTAAAGGRELTLRDKGDGSFTFTMPGSAVEVRGVFTASAPVKLPFTDVEKGIWYYDAVQYVYENGLMAGTSADTFSPDLATSRGMIVTILYRLAGSPAVGASDFTDVPANQYYSAAVAWAAANRVVSGYGDGRFGPNDPITREQMALILQGYARLEGRDVSARADLSAYTDAGKVSDYALEAIRWARAVGLINGTSATTLTPGGTATRAQAAVIFRGFCENVVSGG
jgi:hypothetical protein